MVNYYDYYACAVEKDYDDDDKAHTEEKHNDDDNAKTKEVPTVTRPVHPVVAEVDPDGGRVPGEGAVPGQVHQPVVAVDPGV